MSLRVWLPLTKDLRNQGLDDVTVTNNGATFNSAGKLGGSYTGRIDVSSSIIPTVLNGSEFTVAFWIYINEVPTGPGVVDTYVMACGTGGTRAQFHIAIRQNGAGFAFCFYSDDYTFYNTVTDKVGKWMHVVCAFKNNTQIVYVDGTKVGERATAGGLNVAANSVLNIYAAHERLNDFRIYDHCLSPMEVKELSKGLVLHYTLGDKAIESTTNLFYPLVEASRNTNPAWDKSLNGNYMIHCDGFGDGYNSGVSNPTAGYHGHWTYDENNKLIGILPNLNSIIGQANRWLGLTASISSASIGAGNSYTISWEQKTDNLNCYVNAGYYYKKKSSESGYGSFHDGTKNCKNTLINTWQSMEASFTLSQDWDGTYTGGTVYFYGNYGSEGTTYLRNLQFETKNHATAFVNGLTTRTSNIIYDCSGFCNNGMISGNLTVSSDTPKYSVSTKFNGAEKISANSLPSEVQSVSFWVKVSTIPSGYGICYVDSNTQTSIGFYNGNSFITSCTVSANVVLLGTTFKANEWNHIVLVKTGANTRNVYCNGILLTNSGTNSWVHNGSNLSLGWRDYASGNAGWFNGQLCDFRAYATALSADDVKSLYQNSAYIDSSGNVYGTIHES